MRPGVNSSVIDFGAGVGTLAAIFAQRTGVRPLAVEADVNHQSALNARGIVTYAAISDVPGQVDFVYSSNVLEHIEDDVAVLRELHGKLAPGGGIAIFVPAFEVIWSKFDDKVGHHRRYTIKSLRENLTLAGFTVEEIRYCDVVGFFLALLFKLVGSKSGEPSVRSLRFFDRVLFPISKALDLFAHRWLGKNVLAYATRS
ncbi:class I SAM-dependent methyltransferase [Burkholderia sp. F1]